jgi:HlyD family secretion protein
MDAPAPRDAVKRRRFVRWTVAVVVLAALAGLIYYVLQPKPVTVSVRQVERGTVERTVTNTRAGTVKACRRAKLSPSLGGQIAHLPIKEGDGVKAGQLLLELWNKDLAAEVGLAERQVAASRAQVRSVCAKSDVARRNADRLNRLRKSDAATAERADNAAAEAAALQADCDGARIQVTVREAQLAASQANLERTRLFAPFDGIIGAINGELYEFVTPSPLGVPTPPVVDIIGNNCFYVKAPIDEVDVAGIQLNMPVRISLDAFPHRRFAGRVRRIADFVLDVEKQARTVDVEVAFSTPDDFKYLLAGYSADIEVVLETRPDVIRVPTEAVIDGQRVYVLAPSTGRIQLRTIKTGLSNWDHTEVLDGVTPGELVVTNADQAGLHDGAAAVRSKEKP